VEDLLDYGLPYWNVCDERCADPNSEAAGIPQAFLDDTYRHPSGETRPNPLRWSLGLDGLSTAGGKYVTRDPDLVRHDVGSKEWKAKIQWAKLYYQQAEQALRAATFSYPENVTTGALAPDGKPHAFGVPWANVPTFSQDQPLAPYVYENPVFPYIANFDGFFEQVHDNWHGWIGGSWTKSDGTPTNGDMADNTTTSADPIFLSYHANIDRIGATYLETHPQAMFTAGFPLRPFKNQASNGSAGLAAGLDYEEPRAYMYTTLGDMTKDTRALGYVYGPPLSPSTDLCSRYRSEHVSGSRTRAQPSGGSALVFRPAANDRQDLPAPKLHPVIVFTDIRCTDLSYTIDCYVDQVSAAREEHFDHPNFLGRITRIGMGSRAAKAGPSSMSGSARCRKSGITRVLSLSDKSDDIIPKVSKNGFHQVVTEVHTGRVIKEEEWATWPGFKGVFAFGVDKRMG
jgi:hypothetical protein